MITTMKRALAMAAVAMTAGIALAGCAAGVDSGRGPGERQSVVEDVDFYPACGNETLTLNGTTWYSMSSDDSPALSPTEVRSDASTVLPHAASPNAVFVNAMFPTVVAPGPGDDTGSLTIYEGGYAFFQSDNGELTRWLTTEPIEYNFVC